MWAGYLSRYSHLLRAGGSGDRIPLERDFPSAQTSPGAHPASYTMGTGSLPGVKYGRGVLLTTHPLLVPWSWKSRSILLPNLWATTGPVTGTLHLYLYITLILRRSRTGTVWFYTSTSNKRAARPKLYTESLTRDLKPMYSCLTLVRISINL